MMSKKFFLIICSSLSMVYAREKNPPCKLHGMVGEQPDDVCLVAEVWKKMRSYDPQRKDRPQRNTYMYHGPSGVGKKMAARLLAKETNSTLMEINLLEEYKIHNASKKIRETYQAAKKKVEETGRPVFIHIEVDDEVADNTGLLHKEIQDTFGNPYIVTIVTVRDPSKTTPGLQSRCSGVIFDLPNAKNRAEALRAFAQEKKIEIPEWYVRLVALSSWGASYQDIKDALEQAATVVDTENRPDIKKTQLFHELSKQNYISSGIGCSVSIVALILLTFKLRYGKFPQIPEIKIPSWLRPETKPAPPTPPAEVGPRVN